MLVELTADRAGLSWVQHEGDIVDLDDTEALALIAAGTAKELDNNRAGADASKPADIFQPNKQRTRRR